MGREARSGPEESLTPWRGPPTLKHMKEWVFPKTSALLQNLPIPKRLILLFLCLIFSFLARLGALDSGSAGEARRVLSSRDANFTPPTQECGARFGVASSCGGRFNWQSFLNPARVLQKHLHCISSHQNVIRTFVQHAIRAEPRASLSVVQCDRSQESAFLLFVSRPSLDSASLADKLFCNQTCSWPPGSTGGIH